MKTAIAIDLELVRAYMVEFIAERELQGDLMQALTLSSFLVWLQNKSKGETNEQTQTTSTDSSNRQVRRFTNWT